MKPACCQRKNTLRQQSLSSKTRVFAPWAALPARNLARSNDLEAEPCVEAVPRRLVCSPKCSEAKFSSFRVGSAATSLLRAGLLLSASALAMRAASSAKGMACRWPSICMRTMGPPPPCSCSSAASSAALGWRRSSLGSTSVMWPQRPQLSWVGWPAAGAGKLLRVPVPTSLTSLQRPISDAKTDSEWLYNTFLYTC